MKIVHTYEEVTNWFFATLQELQKSKKIILVGLAGGTSFDAWYQHLLKNNHAYLPTGQAGRTGRSDRQVGQAGQKLKTLENLRWCVTDERVNCEQKDRNDAHIWDVFLGPLCEMGLSREEYFIRPKLDDNGSDYSNRILQSSNPPNSSSFAEALLRRTGPLSRGHNTNTFKMPIDIAFLGMGPDGHTASIFPHSIHLHSFLNQETPPAYGHLPLTGEQQTQFIFIKNAPKPPPERISLSPFALQRLNHVCLFGVGTQKKEAFQRFLDDSVPIIECPVKLLKPEIVLDLTQ